ncbi:DUF6385 domain-containing protein [Pelorhabdus rhamnosifermentans]|uniref:DUF6385 domain-containing protein n=1 Tax=Pelorhabdus rhamnosifermentans TaxID=2772457 RepID=UPI0035E40F53
MTDVNVSSLNTWTWFLYTTAADATTPPVVRLQISPDDNNLNLWYTDTTTTISSGTTLIPLVSGNFLKYSRLYFTNDATAAVTLNTNVWFNGQG